MKIAVSEFKAKCLQLIDQLGQVRDPIVLTKHGKPVAKLVPIDDEPSQSSQFGYMAGTATISDDIVAAVAEPWGSDEDGLFEGINVKPGRRQPPEST